MKIEGIKITLTQDEDCCGRVDNEYQSLELEILDGGGGPYAVISTQRWAVDHEKDLPVLTRFIEKMMDMYGAEAK